MIIGAVAGVIVVFSVLFFEKIRIDDTVGAISVHGVNGAWGTLAAGLFNMGGTSMKIIGVQVLGIVSCFIRLRLDTLQLAAGRNGEVTRRSLVRRRVGFGEFRFDTP